MAYPAPRLYLRSPNSADQLGQSVLYNLDPYSSIIDSEFLVYAGQTIGLGVATVKQHPLVPGSTTPGSTTTNPIFTTPGSTVFYIVARGEWATGSPTAPTDNLGNTIALASGPNAYSGFPSSQSAIYQVTDNVGGNNHTATLAWGSFSGTAQDEATIAVVETLGVNTIQTQSFIERSGAGTISSSSVTTTTPTLLLAVVLGTGNTGQLHTFTSTTGFTKITQASAEGDIDPNGYIQASVFYKYAPAAGTYTASFTTTASEGAQIYLLALQNTDRGTLGQTIGGPGLSATGTVAVGSITGTLNQTLGVLTSSAAGTINIAGSATPTFGALTNTGVGTVKVAGSATPSMGALANSGAGTVGDTGVLNQALGTLTSSAVGTIKVSGSATPVLGSLSSSATGTVADAGVLTATLGSLGISATGLTTNTVTGSLSVTMGALTDAATGAVPVAGASAAPLGALTDTGTATVTTHSALAQSMGSLSGVSAGAVKVASTLSQALGGISDTATGTVTDNASLSATTGSLGLSATGTVLGSVTGSLTATLGVLSLSASATGVNTSAKLTRSLGALITNAQGTSNSLPSIKSLIEGDAVAVNNDGSTSHEIS